MKKIIMLALIIAASSAVYAVPGKKKKKEAEKTEQPKPVVLTSASDTLSYAAGKMLTRGLDQYLISELKVDTAYMAEVEAGFREGMTRDAADPKAVAHSAGLQVAQMVLGRMLPGIEKQFAGSEHTIDKTKLCEGFVSALRNDTTIMTTEHATNTFTQMRKADEEKANAAWKAKNEQWLKDNAQKEGVKTTESGLQYKVITEGHGAIAQKSSTVTVKYEGKLIDGTVFDSSYKRNPQTTDFKPEQVIKGWTEALCMMPEGSKWELYIPQNLAYGERAAGGTIKPFSTLIFTVELVKVKNEEPKAEKTETAGAAKKAPAKKPVAKKKVRKAVAKKK